MESKIEYILLAIIAGFTFLIFNIEYDSPKPVEPQKAQVESKKMTEVNNFIFYEINKTTLHHKLISKKGEEIEKNSWILTEPIIENKDIEYLTAKESTYRGDVVVFTKDVKALKRDGLFYQSQKAIYNLKEKKIVTPDRFVITNFKDMVTGKELTYDIKNKVTEAKDVNGTFELKKSNN